MKAEGQALHLEKMMQKHYSYSEYELTMPLVEVKKSMLKNLAVDDVILVGFEQLEILLLQEEMLCGGVVINNLQRDNKLKIIYLKKDTLQHSYNKKYKILKFSFGIVQSRTLEIGREIEISHIDLQEVTLIVDGEKIAKGSLVNVDEEIAILIKEVKRQGKKR